MSIDNEKCAGMKFDAESILAFWFAGDALTPEGYQSRWNVWFQPNDAFDEQIRSRFEDHIVSAVESCERGLDIDAKHILARIIATDQFPRNIYRGTPQAFAFDAFALELTKNMIDSGRHEELSFVERLFVYLPLEHSERIENQMLSVQMYEILSHGADHPYFQSGAAEAVKYAVMHRDIIEKFGRFPHRNDILGRESTCEEIAFLNSGVETFGQVKK